MLVSPSRVFIFRLLIHLDTVTGAKTTGKASHCCAAVPFFPPPVETNSFMASAMRG